MCTTGASRDATSGAPRPRAREGPGPRAERPNSCCAGSCLFQLSARRGGAGLARNVKREHGHTQITPLSLGYTLVARAHNQAKLQARSRVSIIYATRTFQHSHQPKSNTKETEKKRRETGTPWPENADDQRKTNILPHLLLDRRAPDLLDALHAGPHVGLHPPPPLVVRAARRLAAPDAAPPRGLFPREGREAVLEHGHLALGLAAVRRAPRPS